MKRERATLFSVYLEFPGPTAIQPGSINKLKANLVLNFYHC